jgi:hypothetical protein
MEKIFENITHLTTRNEYDTIRAHIELLIKEATECGYFSDPEGDNEYIQEFGRLARLSALYEDEFMDLGFIMPKTKSVPKIQKETQWFRKKQNTNAKELILIS